jgi:hypothetical protein
MSRLMADQESRGGDGDPGAGEEDSVMRVNLAEGCGAVNRETRRVKRETGATSSSKFQEPRTVNLESSPVSPVPQVSPVSRG